MCKNVEKETGSEKLFDEFEFISNYTIDLEHAAAISPSMTKIIRPAKGKEETLLVDKEYTDRGIKEAQLIFQAIHNEPFFEKQCYTLTWFVPDMPEDYRSNPQKDGQKKKSILGVSIYNEDFKLMIPHLCIPYDDDGGAKYWESFLKVLFPGEKDKTIIDKIRFCAVSVFNRIRIQEYTANPKEITLKLLRKITVAPYCRGDICVCLPLPDENPDASGLEVVVQGERLRENIQSISENLDLRLKQLFIKAPSGSGKEGYSTYVHYGSGRKGEPNKVDMTSPRKEVEKMLRGSVVEKGVLVEGLFAKASGGTIVFDEIDKLEAKSEVFDRDLSYLLRPLDPGKYLPENGSEELDVEDVAMIFMGSETPERLKMGPQKQNGKRISPRDFFTRVSDPWVDLQHPLPDAYNDEFNTTFSCLVRYFYWKAVEEMALGETGLDKQSKRKKIKRINILLQKSILGKLDCAEPTTAERRFISYLVKWLGQFTEGVEARNNKKDARYRFHLIKTLWFKVEIPKLGYKSITFTSRSELRDKFLRSKKPSVREISKVVRSFVRKNWHSAERSGEKRKGSGLIFNNLQDNELVTVMAAELSKGLKLRGPKEEDYWVHPDTQTPK